MNATRDKKGKEGLKGRLADYSAAARAGATRSTLGQRLGNWPIYAAATGSALAMATGASANTIVTYTGAPVTVSELGNGLKTGGITLAAAHLRFTVDHAPNLERGFAAARVSGGYGVLTAGGSSLEKLSSGVVVGAGGKFTTFGVLLVDSSGQFRGNWAAGVPAFEGFEFNAGGHEDYGWAKVEVGVDGGGYPDSVTLLGMAYDSSGASIKAGDTGTPEPGTAGLMLLALGAAGVTALRKRKQSA